MSRTIPAAILAALSQESVEPFYAVELKFSAGTVRFWTGYGDRTIDGQTYTGTGNLLNISGIEEVADLSAKGITVPMVGLLRIMRKKMSPAGVCTLVRAEIAYNVNGARVASQSQDFEVNVLEEKNNVLYFDFK